METQEEEEAEGEEEEEEEEADEEHLANLSEGTRDRIQVLQEKNAVLTSRIKQRARENLSTEKELVNAKMQWATLQHERDTLLIRLKDK